MRATSGEPLYLLNAVMVRALSAAGEHEQALAAAEADIVLLDLDGDAEPSLALVRALATRGDKVLLACPRE